ncbi:hypothetical protein KGF54_005090 [Candida jiufengensis]|uniref:uncharacterized protein n=1 Tax=Candida jiufengensis TaxID=497108 RepID=UPI002224286B|nr:uncharacterized protein KGF54_005090 [Candida jiufengensis]KAI5952015.1 hypothetical protein KGF54_005090 [Candida jiufengensis]
MNSKYSIPSKLSIPLKYLPSKLTFPTKLKLNNIIIIGLLSFTFINILFVINSSSNSNSNSSSSLSSSSSSSSSSLSSISTKQILNKLSSSFNIFKFSTNTNDEYSLIGYHHDDDSNFVIIEKNHINEFNINSELNFNNHYYNFLNSDLNFKKNYDLHLIEGYNYQNYLNNLKLNINLHLNNSLILQYENELNFNQAFKDFFLNLIEIIENCKPMMSSINNKEHYSNEKIIEKNFQILMKINDEEMNKINKEDFIHRDGKLPFYLGHLRENYINEPIRNKDYLSSFLQLNSFEMDSLKKSHEKFINLMLKEWPKDLIKLNKFNNFLKGDGIVYLGGDKYDQLVLLSIKLLRSNGSKLPVEVIIPKREDYNVQFCDQLLPSLNGKCKVMSDYLPKKYFESITNKDDRSGGYQLKNIAIFISSFENILYIDADNLPLKNPDILFANQPFINNHLVLWPDLWRRSTSPKFYEIANIKVDPHQKIRNSYIKGDKKGENQNKEFNSFHDCKGTLPETSSETGQLMINKKIHFKTLVLSLYYNYYGPDFYYPLLSQGAAGEGDKETIIVAAHKLNLPYYQVQEFNREFGPILDKTNKHEFFGMGQYDPIIDYIQYTSSKAVEDEEKELEKLNSNNNDKTKNKKKTIKKKKTNKDLINYKSTPPTTFAKNFEDKSISNYNYHLFQSSSLFFLHANWPKYYIEQLFTWDERGPIDKKGHRRRLYGNDLKLEVNNKIDFELEIINHLYDIWCKPPWIDLKHVPESGSAKRDEVCKKIELQQGFLKTT